MAEDITSLVLKVESNQVSTASKRLDKLGKEAKQAERATDKINKSFGSMAKKAAAGAGAILAAIGAYQGLSKLVEVTREFDILNAQLVTATGSAENAAVAFEAIQDFATRTPFALGEVTESFVQLVNRGLDPSERSLTNVGNFAAAFGRNILDATRAIGQATTGEFESLKQFGIVARKEGDQVKFTFRGLTETVDFSTKAIQGYMNRLSEENFGGAMEERANTLDGALSNLDDSWDKLWLTISRDSPIGDAIEGTVRKGIEFLEKLEAKVRSLSGEETRSLNELVSAFDSAAERLANLDSTDRNFGRMRNALEELRGELSSFSGTEVELARTQNALQKLIEKEKEISQVSSRKTRLTKEERAEAKATRDLEIKAVQEEKAGIQSKIALLEIEIAKQKEAAGINKDRLAKFDVTKDQPDPVTGGMTEDEQDKLRERFERLRESLLTERELIEESYIERKKLAEDYAKFTGESVADIEARLLKEKTSQIDALNRERWSTALSSFDDFQNNIEVLARTGSKELAAIYKSAAIANTIIKTYESATSAYSAMVGIPFVGPALATAAAAAAVAAGMANVQAISSTPVGQYADGGVIPGTKYAGDSLTANVNSGEMILNRDQQRRLFNMANGGGSGGKQTVVNIQNYGSDEVDVQESETDENRIINIAVGRAKRETKREIASDVRTGSGDVSRAMESSFNLKRGTA